MAQMLESSIIHATVSKQIFDLDVDLIVVPYFNIDGTQLRKTVGIELIEQTTYLPESELIALIDALSLFGIDDIDSITEDFDFTPIFTPGNMAQMLESSIIHATVSKQIFDLTVDLIVVPYFNTDNTQLRITVGVEVAERTTYLPESELVALIDALGLFGIDSIDSITDEFDFAPVFEEGNMALMLESKIIHATISKQILDLADDDVVSIPFFNVSSQSIRATVGDAIALTQTIYIIESELIALIDALDLLEITDFNTFTGTIDLSVVTQEGNLDIMLESAIIHATISKQLFDLSNDDVLIVPYFDVDGVSIRIYVGDSLLGTDTVYLSNSELDSLIGALEILEITDIESFTGTVDLSLLTEEGAMTSLLSSAIIHATVSNQLFELGIDDTIEVPYYDSQLNELRKVVGDVVNQTDTLYLVKVELESLIDALNVLQITDIETFSGTIDLTLLQEDGAMDTLL
ncbi:MAG: hypothetical protein U1C51_03445, partial [Candidatus Izemoplasmatales bacterium]|nr:hypothetical protein [Candidatus Izemoplasmatales bacterium]